MAKYLPEWFPGIGVCMILLEVAVLFVVCCLAQKGRELQTNACDVRVGYKRLSSLITPG